MGLLLIGLSFFTQAQVDLTPLSQTPKWLALLHYQAHGFTSKLYSEVDDETFFLAPDGKYNPLAELNATLAAFQQPNNGDDAPQCRFPERLHWLTTVLPNTPFVAVDCPKFEDWYSKVKGSQLSLIFPASYMNSPSSMFGHTLLRLDGKQGHQLLSAAINFAAFTDPNDDELTFTVKGLTGGYPGYVSLVPYFEKVNEYNHIESRDIWEYQLKLSYEQIQTFTRHIWELNEIRFDYFFIDENCSYRLLTLLNVIEPSWHLAQSFDTHTIPTDTLRVLEAKQLIGDIQFRPSKTTKIEQHRLQLSDELRELARALADAPELIAQQSRFKLLSDIEKTQVLDLAYEYTRYLNVKKKNQDPALLKRSLKLLSLRSKVNIQGDGFDPIQTPEVRDEQGHDTFRTTLGAAGDFAEIGFRINYHDWLDNLAGYRKGAQIEMGNARFRFDQSRLQLQNFNAISVRTLVPRNRFNQSISWQVNGGYERGIVDDLGQLHVTLGGGLGYQLGMGTFYGFAQTQLASGRRYENGWALGLGSELGYLIQVPNYNVWIKADYLKNVLADGEGIQYQFGAGLPISVNQQIRFEWQQQGWNEHNEEQIRLSYVIYH